MTGASYLSPHGDPPDVLCELANDALGRDLCVDEFVAWYTRTALAALDLGQQMRTVRRREQLARRHGHPSYFAYRDAAARQAGYRSFWHYRQTRWGAPDTTAAAA